MDSETLKRALLALMHDVACRARYRRPVDEVSPDERAALVAELASFFRGVEEMCDAHVEQAGMLVESRLYEALHGQPGVDNEMLDQALEFHGKGDKSW